MKKFLILTAIVLLSGCAAFLGPTPPPALTLDQMLAGKSDAEQHAMLKDLCLQEAQKTPFDKIVWNFYGENRETSMLTQICNKMAAEMKPCTIDMH